MTEVRLRISSPWVTYVNKLKVLFGQDPNITIEYDNVAPSVTLRVSSATKYDVLNLVLPNTKTFGNITLKINVVPANGVNTHYGADVTKLTNKQKVDILFDGNPAFAFSHEVTGALSNTLVYVAFKNKVVQFFNDNLSDVHGNISTLYQDIAEDLIGEETSGLFNVCFCTDVEENIGKPTGQWP